MMQLASTVKRELLRTLPTKDPAPAPVIEVVGTVAVPPEVLRHRFFLEAVGNAHIAAAREDEQSRVVGTQNTKSAELYGWGHNVSEHVDNTGFMYLLPLQLDRSMLYAKHLGELWEQRLVVGEVVRLWDHAVHWTEDRANVVAGFVGSFPEPRDAEAVEILHAGVAALARGDYYGSPRVGPGYRVVLPDECWATDDFETAEIILRADAKAKRMKVLPCAQCRRPAVRLDNQWPYHWDRNVCREHLQRERA